MRANMRCTTSTSMKALTCSRALGVFLQVNGRGSGGLSVSLSRGLSRKAHKKSTRFGAFLTTSLIIAESAHICQEKIFSDLLMLKA